MSTSLLYHSQSLVGFQACSYEFGGGCATATIRQKSSQLRCTACGSADVTAVHVKDRLIQGLAMGRLKFWLRIVLHRLKCRACGAFRQEALPFVSHVRARQTRALERFVIELRQHMSISSIAKLYGLNWKTIKDIEKRHLRRKYRHIRLRDVRYLGLDEIHVGKKRFLTIAVDLKTGAVLCVVKGRGADCLRGFARRLKLARARIEAVAIDMAGGYTSWAREHLPNAVLVYDHFHVIKLMNAKVDEVRREAVRQAASGAEGKIIKGKRWLLLHGLERLSDDARSELRELWKTNRSIAIASMLKEKLRWIYRHCRDGDAAAAELKRWCELAEVSEVGPVMTMANTIRNHWNGILAYWDTRLTTGKLEGFNNKVRWLIRQAYGYADEEYFFLKILDLPEVRLERDL